MTNLKLTDLNDYIAPGSSCIKPSKPKAIRNTQNGEFSVEKADEIKVASITLNDCLACSGCITSAETVLISSQSKQQFYDFVKTNIDIPNPSQRKKLVVSISEQSRASFAAKYNITVDEVMVKLKYIFRKQLCMDNMDVLVFDLCLARDIALVETAKEFVHRVKTKSQYLPVMTSSCPGWICYAEKTHGSFVLPYISTAKSPQQVMGCLVKSYLLSQCQQSLQPNDIYHLSIMPCFDKKLEASRQDFYNDIYNCRDVDCVLSTAEVEDIILENGYLDLLLDTNVSNYDIRTSGDDLLAKSYSMESSNNSLFKSSSGGYLGFTMEFACRELYGLDLYDEQRVRINIKEGRNVDWTEYALEIDGNVSMIFIKAYGFRNIQNIIRQAKTQKTVKHFVEIMACPTGCINGGGQLKPNLRPGMNTVVPSEIKELVQKADEIYHTSISTVVNMEKVLDVYRTWSLVDESAPIIPPLHTQYHNVQANKDDQQDNAQW